MFVDDLLPTPHTSQKTYIFLNIDPQQFAEQLTIMEYEIYNKITTNEFANFGWLKEDGEKIAPHLRELSDVSNHIGHWVSCEILNQKSSKERRAIIEHCLDIVDVLYIFLSLSLSLLFLFLFLLFS